MAFLLPSFAQQKNPNPAYEVYAISYGVIPNFPVANLVAGADRSRKLDIQMMVWLLKGSNGANILVDSGFYRDKLFKQWKVRDFIKPSEAIAKLGLKPEEITDLIITHMHWDHAGGIDLFPKARIWIQQDEFTYYTGNPEARTAGSTPKTCWRWSRLTPKAECASSKATTSKRSTA